MNAYFDEGTAREDLGRRALRGGATMITARVATGMIQVGSVLFLARLLTPEDYGLVAMVAALTGFAPIFVDLGTRDAVVQRAGLTEAEVSALFWITIGAGCACALLVAVSGPLLAAFYGEPRLTGIVRVSSLTFVVFAITAQHQALLRRAVMFRELAMLDISANLLSALGAVALAYGGFGYWALVTRPISMYGIAAVGTFWYCRWVPPKPVWTDGVRAMVKFGLNLCGFTMTDFVARNSDRVAVGWGLGARTLGFYQNALFVYDNVLDVLVFPLHQVAVSGLSRLRGDVEALREAWAKTLSSVTFFVMPAFGVLAITGADLVVLLLGDKWAPAGALLSVLALRGTAHSAERTLGWLHVAAGRTDRWLRWGIAATCVQLLGFLCGLPFGPFGIAWANVVSMFVLFVPALVYAGRPFGIGVRDVIAVIGPQWIGALTAAGVGFAVRGWLLSGAEPIERAVVLTSLYVTIYGLLVVGFFRVTLPLRVGLALVSDLLAPGWARWVSRPGIAPAGAGAAGYGDSEMTPMRRGHLRRFETLLGRVEMLPWCALYRVAIGFCLVPVFARYRGASSDWRLLPFFVVILLTLRLVPAAIRRLVPFSAELQAQWFQQRILAKRFDSYQWSKLVWFGLGIMLYDKVFDRMDLAPTVLAFACLLLGSFGLVVWHRHGRMAWEGLDLVAERGARPQ